MNYLLTGIDLHPDKGFGITADSYYKSAEHLFSNHFKEYDFTQQAEMPQNFLYRHSIELYLKSLIIIFHRKLKLGYGTNSFDSDDPEVLIDGKWKKLYSCHYIDKLYEYWLNHLLLPNIVILNEKAPKGDWVETENITNLFGLISKYDQDSSYFRYPITKNSSLDFQKYTMQKFKGTNLNNIVEEIRNSETGSKGKSFTMLILDEKDEVVQAYQKAENTLLDLRDALKDVAFYFHCIHIMTRVTLCGNM